VTACTDNLSDDDLRDLARVIRRINARAIEKLGQCPLCLAPCNRDGSCSLDCAGTGDG
jgi:hypothetical protein